MWLKKLLAPRVWGFSFIFGHQLKLDGGDDNDDIGDDAGII
jgi:hypothetical protein